MAFQLDTAAFKPAPTISDYMQENRKNDLAQRTGESSIKSNEQKMKQEEIKQAVLLATPQNYKGIRADGINRGLWSAETVPEEWDDNMMRQLKQSVGGVKSDTGFKVVGNQVVRLDESTGGVQPVYTAPSNNPINAETGLPERKLSATEQKELFDATDAIAASSNAKTSLSQALGILNNSPKGAEPYTGTGADFWTGAARLPIIGDIISDRDRAATTKQLKNLSTGQALESLKGVFGGMPTEGERKILLDMQSLPTFSKEEQKRIIGDAERAANRRIADNERKAQAITTGNYSGMAGDAARPSLNSTIQPNQPAAGGITIKSDADYDALPSGAVFISPDGKQRRKP